MTTAKIIGLTRYLQKGEPGERLDEMELIAGIGIRGDYHQGGEKQVSILAAPTQTQSEEGLCSGRFRENILISGLSLDSDTIRIGSAVLALIKGGKRCFEGCPLKSCHLSKGAVFAGVTQGGIIRIGDEVLI